MPVQALSATILGNLASCGDEDFKKAFAEAGGLEKLRELSKSGSLASTPVRKAAASALTDITKGAETCTGLTFCEGGSVDRVCRKCR